MARQHVYANSSCGSAVCRHSTLETVQLWQRRAHTSLNFTFRCLLESITVKYVIHSSFISLLPTKCQNAFAVTYD